MGENLICLSVKVTKRGTEKFPFIFFRYYQSRTKTKKKLIGISVILLFLSLRSNGCPICGCGGGNLYLGRPVTTVIGGVEFNFKKTGIGVYGQLPIAQDFAEGQTRLNFKGMMHFTFSI